MVLRLQIICALLISAMSDCVVGARAGSGADDALQNLLRAYVKEFLRRNPTVSTYLGGAGLDPMLGEADGRLRDYSPAAIEAEDRWLAQTQRALEDFDPERLSSRLRIDREVALAQIRFLLHQHRVRQYPQRALDTYTDEPF